VKRTTLWIAAALAISRTAFAQGEGLELPVGARNVSLAGANIAESSDITAMYENPAALTFIESGSVFINHLQANSPQGMQEDLAVPLVMKKPVAVTLGLDAYHLGYFAGPFTEYGYDIAFAGMITPTLSIGGRASLRQDISNGGWLSAGAREWSSNFSFGGDYAPTPDISYAIVFGGLGKDLYRSAKADTILAQNKTPRTLEVGATMAYPSSASFRPPFLILSLVNEKVFGVKGLYYKGGIEIRPIQFLELRFGYISGPGYVSARYGLGFLWKEFALQYAVYPEFGTHILVQQISASMEL